MSIKILTFFILLSLFQALAFHDFTITSSSANEHRSRIKNYTIPEILNLAELHYLESQVDNTSAYLDPSQAETLRKKHICDYISDFGLLKCTVQEYETAFELFKLAYKISPNDKHTKLQEAKCLGLFEEMDLSNNILQLLIEEDLLNYEAHFTLGLNNYQKLDYAEAMRYFLVCTMIRPNDSYSWYYIGWALYNMDKFEEAIIYAETALMNGNNEALKILGVAHLKLEKYELAVENLKKYLKFHPTDRDLILQIAEIYYHNLKDYEQALAYVEYFTSSNDTDPMVYFLAGSANFHLNRLDKAIYYLEKSYMLEPDNPIILTELSEAYKEIGQFDLAIKFFKLLDLAEPNNEETYRNLGNLYFFQKRDEEEAYEWFLKLYQLDSNNTRLCKWLAYISLNRNEYENSLTYLKRALEIGTEDEQIYIFYSNALSGLDRHGEIIEVFEKFPNQPRHYLFHHHYGNALRIVGKFTEALEQYNKAIKINKFASELYCYRALIFRELKLDQSAEQDLARAIQLLDQDPEDLYDTKICIKIYKELYHSKEKSVELEPNSSNSEKDQDL